MFETSLVRMGPGAPIDITLGTPRQKRQRPKPGGQRTTTENTFIRFGRGKRFDLTLLSARGRLARERQGQAIARELS